MANYGRPHSNNSQFVITAVESTHLDGSNVVFGRVLRGFGIITEMEKFADDEAVPFAVGYHFIFYWFSLFLISDLFLIYQICQIW